MVGAEHPHARAEFRATKRDHMFADMGGDHLAVLWSCIVKDPLDKVVAVLIAGDVNQRNSGPVAATLADTIQVAT